MQPTAIENLKYQIKEFPFIFDPSEHQSLQQQFNMLGYVTVPTIGRYGGGGYQLESPLFVMILPCEIRDGKCEYRERQIHLPEQVLFKLIHIQQKIKHNKLPKKDKKTKQQQQQNLYSPQYNPQTYLPRAYFTLRFIISKSSSFKPQQFMNYVCHNYIFRHQNFQTKKRHVSLIPICLIPTPDSGVFQWYKDYKSISFDEIRSEYISFHMKKGAPAFSPNNMKIGVEEKKKKKVLSFYTVMLTELEYCVNYHWHFMEDEKGIEEMVKETKSVGEMIHWYKAFRGEDQAVGELERLLMGREN